MDLTTIYPVGAVPDVAVNEPDIPVADVPEAVAEAASPVGVVQAGGGVKVKVIPLAGFVAIPVVLVELLAVAEVVTVVPTER